jgi:hypothetical protein
LGPIHEKAGHEYSKAHCRTNSKSAYDLVAVEWLAKYLKDGPKLAREGRVAGQAAGFGLGTLSRARKFLNIKMMKRRWELPPGPLPKYEKKKKGGTRR